ncbi:MAG: DUF4846 domain-containing protein [Flavobacteriales bacterium]|nr:DUF4846 domain-containing protein [Flavobacteriales bacterium]
MHLLPHSLLLVALWLHGHRPDQVAPDQTVEQRFAPPAGFQREPADGSSFEAYLRRLPLKAPGSPVLLHNGQPKWRQDAHAGVIHMSVGRRDLQQCADAIIRLRAEFLFGAGRESEIAFPFTNGFLAEWSRWRSGDRIVVKGNQCRWVQAAVPDGSHAQLQRYLETVFAYAGTISLERQLQPASGAIRIGDVFIHGGSPGHAVIVVDAARDQAGHRRFMIAQGFMPAQEIHVLRNPLSETGSLWFEEKSSGELLTPEWTFHWTERRRWK